MISSYISESINRYKHKGYSMRTHFMVWDNGYIHWTTKIILNGYWLFRNEKNIKERSKGNMVNKTRGLGNVISIQIGESTNICDKNSCIYRKWIKVCSTKIKSVHIAQFHVTCVCTYHNNLQRFQYEWKKILDTCR